MHRHSQPVLRGYSCTSLIVQQTKKKVAGKKGEKAIPVECSHPPIKEANSSHRAADGEGRCIC